MNIGDQSIEKGRQTVFPEAAHRITGQYAALITVMIILLLRSSWLQIVHGSAYREVAENNRAYQTLIPAPRGTIYDRNGLPLTENVPNTNVVISPLRLPLEENETYLVEKISELLPEKSPDAIREAITSARKHGTDVVLATALDHLTVLKFQERTNDLMGVQLISTLVRKYPYGSSAAHVIGYVSTVTSDDLKNNPSFSPIDSTGKTGVERVYDSMLRGTHGAAIVEVDAQGTQRTDRGQISALPGRDLTLTIDIELQKFIFDLLSEHITKRQNDNRARIAGAAIVMNPKSGEIYALASYPSFDPNAFSLPNLSHETSQYLNDDSNPLFNRAVDGTYPSGSIIKPLIAAAALEEHVITPSTVITSTGGISVGPWMFEDWKPSGHGDVTVRKAIAESVNTFFYVITGGYNDFEGLGIERTVRYLKKFGWSQETGIDLPSEAAGLLPTPEWKLREKAERWYIGDTYHFSIGQGDVLVTPLQVAASTSSIAHGRYLFQPHLVDKRISKRSVPVSFNTIMVVRQGMRDSITSGSGRALATLPIQIAGKTGTAQTSSKDITHAWFTSFGPVDDPELVVTVLLEHGGSGDQDAIPIAKEIWQWWINAQ